ncbi:MAG: LacI family DNA-binding transcriptional regulator [Propionivibrio sp.]
MRDGKKAALKVVEPPKQGSDESPAAGKRRRARIVDIANEAGVSVSTVNRVLNRSNNVRDATVQRVLRVAVELDYSFDAAQYTAVEAKPMRLLFLLPAGNNRFINMLGDYVAIVEKTFAPFSIKCILRFHEALDPLDLARKLLKYGQRADGVAFIALEHEAVREAVNRLVNMGRHVVTLVSDLSCSRRIAYVGVNNRAAGRTAGYLMGRLVGERAGKIVVIAGSLSYWGHQQREEGFRAVIDTMLPQVEILGLREAQEDPTQTYRLTRTVLREHADLTGIYNIGGGPDGVARAIKEARMAQKVLYVAHEVTSETRSYLVERDARRGHQPERADRDSQRHPRIHQPARRPRAEDRPGGRAHRDLRPREPALTTIASVR